MPAFVSLALAVRVSRHAIACVAMSTTPEFADTLVVVAFPFESIIKPFAKTAFDAFHHDIKASTSSCAALNARSVASKSFTSDTRANSSLWFLTALTAAFHLLVEKSVARDFHASTKPRARVVVDDERVARAICAARNISFSMAIESLSSSVAASLSLSRSHQSSNLAVCQCRVQVGSDKWWFFCASDGEFSDGDDVYCGAGGDSRRGIQRRHVIDWSARGDDRRCFERFAFLNPMFATMMCSSGRITRALCFQVVRARNFGGRFLPSWCDS